MPTARNPRPVGWIAGFLLIVLALNGAVLPSTAAPSLESLRSVAVMSPVSYTGPMSSGWGNWTQAGTPPFFREGSAVAYDSQSDQVVLFGGLKGLEFQNDTWAYNTSTAVWTNVTVGTAPSARVDAAMAYDTGAHRIMMFGGSWWVWDPS